MLASRRRHFAAPAGFVVACLLAGLPPRASAGTIETIAGGGAGDGLAAVHQALREAVGVAIDPAGNVFIAEQDGDRIRRVDHATGIITTVAGMGPPAIPDAVPYFCGDGGPATAACLSAPSAVALDRNGNLYIADSYNRRIRRVDAASGTITTVAGNGMDADCGDGGPAVAACIPDPSGVAVDGAGNLFITAGGFVRRVDAATGIITRVAGGGGAPCTDGGLAADVAGVGGPIAVDANGDVYVADRDDGLICRIDFATGGTSVIPDPLDCGVDGVALDAAGDVFFGRFRLCRRDATTSAVTIVAGTGDEFCNDDATEAELASDLCVAARALAVGPDGNPVVGAISDRIVRLDLATGRVGLVAGNGTLDVCGDGGPAAGACWFDSPKGLTVTPGGDVLVADEPRVWKIDATTGLLSIVATLGACTGDPSGSLRCTGALEDVLVDAHGSLLAAVGRDGGGSVVRIDPATGNLTVVAGGNDDVGFFCGDGGAATAACLWGPNALASDPAGNLFIADYDNRRVRRVDAATGIISTIAGDGGPFASPCGDDVAATSTCIGPPAGVAVDRAGNVYISDNLQRVRRVDAGTGMIHTIAGNGTKGYCGDGGPATAACFAGPGGPNGIAVDVAGNVFVADSFNNRVRRVDAVTGAISTFAGSDRQGFCGDGGPAEAACLSFPTDVAFDAYGNLVIADAGNGRIRRVRCEPDANGNGICDAYDLNDLAGLVLDRIAVRKVRRSANMSAVFRGTLSTADYAATAGTPFFTQAKRAGFSLQLYAGDAPPTLATPPLVAAVFTAQDCRFRPASAAAPRVVRCTKGSGVRLDLARTSSNGVYRVTGAVGFAATTVTGTLRIVMNLNDTGPLDYQAAIEKCGRPGRSHGALLCRGLRR